MEDDVQDPEEGAGLPPDEGAPDAEPSLEDRLKALQDEIEAERTAHAQQAQDWERRYSETHSWANQANMRAIAAERQLVAMQPLQPPREELQPPTLTDEELERFPDDPKLIWQKMKEASDYTARFIMRQIGPTLQAVPALAAMHENQVELLREVAVDHGRRRAELAGLDPEEYDRNLGEAWQYMNAAAKGDPIALRNMETNPEVIFQAVTMARSRNGVPVVRPERPPTIGGGRAPARAPLATPARSEAVSEMEGIFGRKFSNEQLRRAAADAKELERTHASSPYRR